MARSNCAEPIRFSQHLYRARNLVERFFNKIKQCRRVATRYDKLAANYLALSNSPQYGCGCALMSPRPLSILFGATYFYDHPREIRCFQVLADGHRCRH
jgi:hypothetical protein